MPNVEVLPGDAQAHRHVDGGGVVGAGALGVQGDALREQRLRRRVGHLRGVALDLQPEVGGERGALDGRHLRLAVLDDLGGVDSPEAAVAAAGGAARRLVAAAAARRRRPARAPARGAARLHVWRSCARMGSLLSSSRRADRARSSSRPDAGALLYGEVPARAQTDGCLGETTTARNGSLPSETVSTRGWSLRCRWIDLALRGASSA